MAEKTVKSIFQNRHDTAENWENKNPVLRDGEPIVVIFNDGKIRHKTGYSGKKYNELPFDEDNGTGPSVAVDVTLLASGWTDGQQTVQIENLRADQNGIASLAQTYSDEQYDATVAAKISIASQEDGVITFSCMGQVPQIDIPIVIILLG